MRRRTCAQTWETKITTRTAQSKRVVTVVISCVQLHDLLMIVDVRAAQPGAAPRRAQQTRAPVGRRCHTHVGLRTLSPLLRTPLAAAAAPSMSPGPGSASAAATAAATGNASGSGGGGALPPLLGWLERAGIWWDERLVQIRAGQSGSSGPDLGVFAVADISENQVLCMIPRAAILSRRTTSLASVLEEERLGGGLALTIAVMFEASLGPASFWHGYLASLPPREYLPLFWSDSELELLAGTSCQGKADADRLHTAEDYEEHVAPLLTKYPEAFPNPGGCTLQHFRVAASWVASRSFCVDAWHGDAMVPLADIFNHKASLVLLGDAWGVAEVLAGEEGDSSAPSSEDEEQSSGGGEAGADAAEGDEQEGEGESSEGEGESGNDEDDTQHGFAVGGMPLIQVAGGTAAAAAAAGSDGSSSSSAAQWSRDGVNLRLEIGICSFGPPDAPAADAAEDATAGEAAAADEPQQKRQRRADQKQQQQQQQQWPARRLEIVAASPVPAGAEVHNTYGELSNAELVNRYGFCLPLNPFDEIQVADSWAEFISSSGSGSGAAAAAGAGFEPPKELQCQVAWLQQHSGILADAAAAAAAAGGQEQEQEQHPDGDGAPEPPTIAPGGRLDHLTAAVVRLLGASSAQLQDWASLEDVLEMAGSEEEEEEEGAEQSNGDAAPQAVPLDAAAAGCSAGQPKAAAAAGAPAGAHEAPAVAQHFNDIRLADRDAAWWGRRGLEVLAAAVQRRLQRYPASLAADRAALQQGLLGRQQGEHAVAVVAALQLRVCEQAALQQVLDGVARLTAAAGG